MFNSNSLDVAIGLSLVYLTLSVLCLGLVELVEAIAKGRAKVLYQAIEGLLQDKMVAQELYQHPLIRGLYRGQAGPSYIPARAFATALLHLILPEGGEGVGARVTRMHIEKANGLLVQRPLQDALGSLLERADGQLARLRTEIETWYDQAMDRASGRYKRRAQTTTLVIALGLVVALNADSLRILRQLSAEPAVRAAAVAAAEGQMKSPPVSDASKVGDNLKNLAETYAKLDGLGLSLGWAGQPPPWQYGPPAFLQWLLGLLLTVFAVSFGAPFWFDVLGKFVVIRSTVKPHEKSPEERPK
jgi:hypothetical protein